MQNAYWFIDDERLYVHMKKLLQISLFSTHTHTFTYYLSCMSIAERHLESDEEMNMNICSMAEKVVIIDANLNAIRHIYSIKFKS